MLYLPTETPERHLTNELSDLNKLVNGYLGMISVCFLQEEEGAMRAS